MNYQIKDIEGSPGYRIDTNGQAWSCHKRGTSKLFHDWRKLKLVECKSGYLGIKFNKKWLFIHRAVAQAFLPNPKNKPFVCHKNDIPSDNKVDNLYWGTQKENVRDAMRSGRHKINTLILKKGEDHLSAKLKDADIPLIWELLKNSRMTYKRIGEIFGVQGEAISNIARKKRWTHITRSFSSLDAQLRISRGV